MGWFKNMAGAFAVATLLAAALPTQARAPTWIPQSSNGNPVAAITDQDGLTADSVAYLCGPPAMIEAARKHLEHLGLAPENIFAEQFVAST